MLDDTEWRNEFIKLRSMLSTSNANINKPREAKYQNNMPISLAISAVNLYLSSDNRKRNILESAHLADKYPEGFDLDDLPEDYPYAYYEENVNYFEWVCLKTGYTDRYFGIASVLNQAVNRMLEVGKIEEFTDLDIRSAIIISNSHDLIDLNS